jgi:hypothetical protein
VLSGWLGRPVEESERTSESVPSPSCALFSLVLPFLLHKNLPPHQATIASVCMPSFSFSLITRYESSSLGAKASMVRMTRSRLSKREFTFIRRIRSVVVLISLNIMHTHSLSKEKRIRLPSSEEEAKKRLGKGMFTC